MRTVLLLAFVFASFIVNAQKPEFEGEIRYMHFFRYKQFVPDSIPVIREFGNSSIYLYKKGTYKWTFSGSDLQDEYSFSNTRKTYNKYKYSDSIILNKNIVRDSILKYEIKKNVDTIMGYPVDMIAILTGKKNDPRSQLLRRIYYNSSFPIQPQSVSHLKSFANDEVFKLIKSVPLRIEMETQTWPFVVRYQAYSIKKRPVSDTELQLPKGAKVKN